MTTFSPSRAGASGATSGSSRTTQNAGTSTAQTAGAPTRATPRLHSSETPRSRTGSTRVPTPASLCTRGFGCQASSLNCGVLALAPGTDGAWTSASRKASRMCRWASEK